MQLCDYAHILFITDLCNTELGIKVPGINVKLFCKWNVICHLTAERENRFNELSLLSYRENYSLTLFQTTNFGLFQKQRVCRRQFYI